MFGFQQRIRLNLSVAGETFTTLFVRHLAVFQQVVIEPTALLKRFVERLDLFFGGVHAILKHLIHG
jgi:hypothetical protein